jgi:hypothetical protein
MNALSVDHQTPKPFSQMDRVHFPYMYISGCPTEAKKIFNHGQGKIDERTISCSFIDFPEKSKGFRFLLPSKTC